MNVVKWLSPEPIHAQIHSIHHVTAEAALGTREPSDAESPCCGGEDINPEKRVQLLETPPGFAVRFDDRHTLLINPFPSYGGLHRRYNPAPDGSYHVFDYSCFWFNIRANVADRVRAWHEYSTAAPVFSPVNSATS